MAIFKLLKTGFRSDGKQLELEREFIGDKSKSLQKGITTLLEASLDHLWITPPSHFTLQKVRGFVDGLTGLWGEMTTTTIEKYSYANG